MSSPMNAPNVLAGTGTTTPSEAPHVPDLDVHGLNQAVQALTSELNQLKNQVRNLGGQITALRNGPLSALQFDQSGALTTTGALAVNGDIRVASGGDIFLAP